VLSLPPPPPVATAQGPDRQGDLATSATARGVLQPPPPARPQDTCLSRSNSEGESGDTGCDRFDKPFEQEQL
jgi:hypothetical protein